MIYIHHFAPQSKISHKGAFSVKLMTVCYTVILTVNSHLHSTAFIMITIRKISCKKSDSFAVSALKLLPVRYNQRRYLS